MENPQPDFWSLTESETKWQEAMQKRVNHETRWQGPWMPLFEPDTPSREQMEEAARQRDNWPLTVDLSFSGMKVGRKVSELPPNVVNRQLKLGLDRSKHSL